MKQALKEALKESGMGSNGNINYVNLEGNRIRRSNKRNTINGKQQPKEAWIWQNGDLISKWLVYLCHCPTITAVTDLSSDESGRTLEE